MNEKTKHTPGPWKAYGLAIYTEAKRKHWVSPRDPKQSLIANARENEDGDPETVVDNPPSMAEAEANAQLIASAPELLEALELLVTAVDVTRLVCGMDAVDRCVMQARTAIAKARGEKGGGM